MVAVCVCGIPQSLSVHLGSLASGEPSANPAHLRGVVACMALLLLLQGGVGLCLLVASSVGSEEPFFEACCHPSPMLESLHHDHWLAGWHAQQTLAVPLSVCVQVQ